MILIDETLDRIVKKLVHVYSPLEIYLFGSLAWGVPHEDSDIDLCIILKDSVYGPADRIRLGLKALRGEKMSIDLLVLTEAEIAQRRNHAGASGNCFFFRFDTYKSLRRNDQNTDKIGFQR